jgi:inorganic pyrophosphatase
MAINATHYDSIPALPNVKRKRDRIVNGDYWDAKSKSAQVRANARIRHYCVSRRAAEDLEWPYDYGFIPQPTLAPDKDPVDILVVNRDGLFSGCLIQGASSALFMKQRMGLRTIV